MTMAGKSPDLAELAALPVDGDGPVFAEPWQAGAFAMTLKLHEAGHFTWCEWATCLSQEIARAQASGDPDLGNTYYDHWMAALERIVTSKGVLSAESLLTRKEAWREAMERTPHGEPVTLQAEIVRGPGSTDTSSS